MKIALLAVALLVVGCGGGNGGGGGTQTQSPFQGHYLGSFESEPADGTVDITVATNGDMTGALHDTTHGLDGTFVGHIKDTGNVSGTVHYDGFQDSTLKGTVTQDTHGHLIGQLIQTQGSSHVSVFVDFSPQ